MELIREKGLLSQAQGSVEFMWQTRRSLVKDKMMSEWGFCPFEVCSGH